MDTNKLLLIVLILIIVMVIVNHIVIITPTQTTTTTTQVIPVPRKPIGGCAGTRYGCCPNGSTPKANYLGSNCNL
jgi:hypothetical protein